MIQTSDLYLDTIGFARLNTAIQVLACNLPVMTTEGTKMRGRLAGALLNKLDLKELVCKSDWEYIDKTVELIQNRERLNVIKEKISQTQNILFNDLEPIRALENFLLKQMQKSTH